MAVTPDVIREQAELLARENREADPSIEKVYWFPHRDEVRLVETTSEVPASGDNLVHPFYYRPIPDDGLPAPSGIALIRPDEVGRVQLPVEWGEWRHAVELD
jgi:hypothetical protein